MLAPMRPSPIMPSCTGISFSFGGSAAALRAVARDQRVRRRVVVEVGRRVGREFSAEFWDDGERELLPELDAPLVERVDVPHRALGEHTVLVERDELAERVGGEARGKDRGGGAV